MWSAPALETYRTHHRTMTSIPRALLRAARSQLHPSMLLLTLLPLLIATVLWGGVLWSGGEAAVNAIQHFLMNSSLASWIQQAATRIGLDRMSWQWEVFAAPVLFALILVPAVVLSVVVIIGVIGAPLAVRHVARAYPHVEARPGVGFVASIGNALSTSAIFMLLWVLTLPLWLIPPLGLVIPLMLWGWLNYRVMLFDALAEHAQPQERQLIQRRHRGSLLVMGIIVAALGVVPTLIWVGGAAITIVFAPVFAVATLWLYVLIFTYSSLVFAHFGLEALARVREESISQQVNGS